MSSSFEKKTKIKLPLADCLMFTILVRGDGSALAVTRNIIYDIDNIRLRSSGIH